ncbi:patatin-like phospholipase family protein [Nocardioides donggukensis]|uniref:Patatin-like phospholipase family protein n=1 Tax=Nocardioides donggukensis TaxID=2774019 RepID=A0A927PZX4_9ACTN|nr:patatin-like phospholipase family protein [Nocardioides donggukensis]MBD8870898.1 patatin-like phospholipase family protein [Nocardioides donggukensis]
MTPSSTATGPDDERVALVLDAGGARSAYQVGALEVLLPELEAQGRRPTVLVGTSAGSLLSAALTSTAHLDAGEQSTRLLEVLGRATKRNVIRPLWRQAPVVAARYASETLGLTGFRLRGFFGTQPLAATLGSAIDWDALHRNVADGTVRASAVCATAVRTGRVTMFTESAGDLPAPSPGQHRRYVHTRLGVPHLMASSAIPALFPSVRVDEPAEVAGWYVDGATRRRVPLAPALELGADRVVVVGTGSLRPAEADPEKDQEEVDLGDGGATLLGAVMDDPLRHDLRRLAETNELAADAGLAEHLSRHRTGRGQAAYRTVPYAAVAPLSGEDLSRVAMEVYRANHGTLRRTLGDPDLQMMHRMLGSDSPLQGELLSYLLFDPDFFDAASDLGRRDARSWLAAEPGLWRTGPLGAFGTDD